MALTFKKLQAFHADWENKISSRIWFAQDNPITLERELLEEGIKVYQSCLDRVNDILYKYNPLPSIILEDIKYNNTTSFKNVPKDIDPQDFVPIFNICRNGEQTARMVLRVVKYATLDATVRAGALTDRSTYIGICYSNFAKSVEELLNAHP